MGLRAFGHVRRRWMPVLGLLVAMALDGCGTGGSKSSRLPLSATDAGIASVQAKLLEPADPAESAVYEGMTRITLQWRV